MASRKRDRQRRHHAPASDLLDRVETLTEQFMDVRAEERRLTLTLDRLRRVKGQLVAELASCAAEATEAAVREALAHDRA
jgi:hypothetical protein